MSKVLDTDQREQAGSSSYNKFEYQVYWIVYRIIENIKNEKIVLFFVNIMMTWLNMIKVKILNFLIAKNLLNF